MVLVDLTSRICADCLTAPELAPVSTGLVGIASVTVPGEPERCVICGFPFADQETELL